MTTTSNDYLFWSLGVPLLACSLAVVVVLLTLHQKDRWDRPDDQLRTDLRHIPPEWIGYRQTAAFACPIEGQATCFALFGDSTFVIGSADPPMLSFFDDTGTLLRTIDLPEEPRAIVCGTPETIFTDKIVVAHPRSIVVYSAEGQPEFFLRAPPSGPGDIVISGTTRSMDDRESQSRSLVLTPDYLFVAESGNRRIYRFSADSRSFLEAGMFVFSRSSDVGYLSYWDHFSFGAKAESPEVNFDWIQMARGFDGFIVYAAPITMTFSPQSDLLYIANPGRHRVDVFTQDGIYQPELSWGEPSGKLEGFTACCNPIGLAALDDGRMLTVEKGISRIKIYRTDGTLDTVVAGPDVLDNLPPELRRAPLEPGGRYFSAVPLSEGRIAVFDFEGLIRIFAPVG
ncbi:MAG: hypothetical protein FWE95_10580 [Planctomycetaceae bacterium]|nr:hypothetical protein [Planctomycetaceae bacterium]